MNLATTIKIGFQLLKNDVKSALQTINPASYRGNAFYMFDMDRGTETKFEYNNKNGAIIAYQKCPQVAAIINRKSQAYVNGKTYILNSNGKAKDKEATSEPANKIRALLKKPNKIQSGKQFEAQAYAMQQLHGFAIVLMMKPFGYDNIDASSMWIIPNWLCEVYESNELFYNENSTVLAGIYFTYGGTRVPLPLSNVVILKDLTPPLCSVLLPESRIKPLEQPINNIIGSYESRGVLIDRRGPLGFLSQDVNPMGNIPMTKPEKDELQAEFRGFGLKKRQSQVILGGAASLKWQSMGFNVAELQLHEEVQQCGIDVCNGLSYPPFLLGLSDSTFNNQAEASRGLYMETIIPESESMYEQWNDIFDTASYNIYIMKDYSHVSALQEDKRNAATARKIADDAYEKEFKNNLLTLNRWLVLIDEDPRTDEMGNMYYSDLLKLGVSFGNTTLNGGDNQPVNGNQNGN